MPENPNQSSFWKALGIAWELGYVIAIPIVVLGIVGRFLDKHFGTSPWLFLAGVIISITLTSFGLVWKFKKLIREVEQANPPKAPKT
ncbi:MAG: AtpZ/AtpI family protein [Patescibacteria group bacterium]